MERPGRIVRVLDLTWGDDAFPLRFTAADDGPMMASIAQGVDATEPRRPEQRARPALVEVLVLGEGRGLNSMRRATARPSAIASATSSTGRR